MSEELKLCPFCGGEFEMQSWQYNRHFPGSIYDFVCRRCGCTFKAGYCETKEEAIEKCNTRVERTCRYVGDEISGGCSECHGWLDPACSYCPSCGAKVLSEEEQGHMVADAIRRLEKAVEQ